MHRNSPVARLNLPKRIFVRLRLFNGDEFKENQYFDFGSYSSRILIAPLPIGRRPRQQ
jgi:hypothetical protein